MNNCLNNNVISLFLNTPSLNGNSIFEDVSTLHVLHEKRRSCMETLLEVISKLCPITGHKTLRGGIAFIVG
ncbi:hypothetical protein OAV25_01610 [Flavobacteriaceae bacterium]|nr:hypothetical protein [Flavobacteriaceae bacterium]